MTVVLDTNVLMSAIFFGGPPLRIFRGWRAGAFKMVISPAILAEYRRVADELSNAYPGGDANPILNLVVMHAVMIPDVVLPAPVCADADDDKFIACALSAAARLIVSGDRHLLAVNGHQGLEILKPAAFLQRYPC